MSIGSKIAITVGCIAGAVAYMIFTTVSSGTAFEYFQHVDQVVSQPAKWKEQRLQIHGNVVAGSILKATGKLQFKFALHRGGKWVDVAYSGIVPDLFRDCAELVATGRLLDGHTFTADELSTKCPSKYDGKRAAGCGEELLEQVKQQRGK